ncbi:MAG: hypothetical protein M1823_004923 [Watsoniomyces obsoletus]|nr:MAG: hypothetical protein M1823_004923 [Watsoniomyces obsoletus]
MDSGEGPAPAAAGAGVGTREDRSPARTQQARPARKAVRPSADVAPSSVRRSHNSQLWSTSASGSPSTSREPSPSKRAVTVKPNPNGRKNSRGGAANGRNGREGPSSGPGIATDRNTLAPSTPPTLGPSIISGEPSVSLKSPTEKGGPEGKGMPRLKTARLKSPPPSASSTQAALLATQSTPSLAMPIQWSSSGATSPRIAPPGGRETSSGYDLDGQPVPSGVRTPVRAAGASIGSGLETVQESSLPSTPAIDLVLQTRRLGSKTYHPEQTEEQSQDEKFPEPKGVSSNEEAKTSEEKLTRKVPAPNSSAQITRPTTMTPSVASASINPKAKANPEGSVQSMTVETETVSSIPQVALSGGTGERGGVGRAEPGLGSVRLRPSIETLKPRKDKRKTMRKAPSLVPGTGTSKADIFEARVASAVDEANSSDSEETFVYESNPPEPPTARPGRHHSRTPSVTSVQSQMEQRAMIFANHPLNSKRSMKFSSNLMTNALSDHETGNGSDGVGFGRGSGRSSGPGSAPHHHHHIGHWARAGRAPQVVLFDNETPFGHLPKQSRTVTANNSRHSSRATSPRNAHYVRVSTSNGKKVGHVASYDIDVESMGDERTPLVGSIRVGRRRASTSEGMMRRGQYTSTNRWLTRFAGCLALTTVILLVVIGALGFFLATTKPLMDVRIHEIMNVLASEQEIMLDLSLEAVNPNMVAVTVEKMDINVFAKSRKMRHDHHHRHDNDDDDDDDDEERDNDVRQYHHQQSSSYSNSVSIQHSHPSPYHPSDSVDRGTDPMPDPVSDSNTMLLGRIFEFDSAPTFDGSPLAHRPSISIGEVRLAKPGNKTEEGGTARWERVLQHPFELIVRGVLKYQLPLSGVVRSAPIGASVLVHPELGVDRAGRMYVEPLPRLAGLIEGRGRGSHTVLEEVGDGYHHPDEGEEEDELIKSAKIEKENR